MRKNLTLLLATCLAALPAAAEFTTVTKAYEVALNNFTAPASLNSTAIFRECETCDPHNVRVTTATEYRVNNKSVTLQEFRERIFVVHNRNAKTVIVLRHLETDTIVRVLVKL